VGGWQVAHGRRLRGKAGRSVRVSWIRGRGGAVGSTGCSDTTGSPAAASSNLAH
jgi:hypothetical protein